MSTLAQGDALNVIYGLTRVDDENFTIRYVGQTRLGLAARRRSYRDELSSGRRRPVLDWIRKYGLERISFVVLEVLEGAELLDSTEVWWIDFLNTHHGTTGLNMNDGGGGNLGSKWSDESRERQSKMYSGSGNPRWGAVMSPETRKRIGDGNRGKEISAQQRQKLSVAFTGEKNHFYGRKHSIESKGASSTNRPNRILSSADVLSILDRHAAGEKPGALAKEHGVLPSTISNILSGVTWSWLTGREKASR